jgi:hypothetical protein
MNSIIIVQEEERSSLVGEKPEMLSEVNALFIIVPHYFENSLSTIIRRQFRHSNRSWQPYYHPVYAWERGLQIKHVMMSL